MLSKAEEYCDVWEEEAREPMQHSRLYDLEPLGVGTARVESLTSYITRLADAHSVGVITLVTREILPLALRLSEQPEGRWASNHWSSVTRGSASLNGVVGGTENWILALEQLTGRHDLRFLTLLTFANVLPKSNLLRRIRAWCPLCYQRWREAGLVVYEPLLWNVECVRVCREHQLALHSCCPYPDCRTTQRPLEARIKPGYCPKCHRWMGDGKLMSEGGSGGTDEEWQWQLWVEQTVGELLATQPRLSVTPCKEIIALRLRAYLDALLDGKKAELARQLNRNMSSIRDWLAGKQLPHLANLLRLCFLFGTTPLGFFTQNEPKEVLPEHAVLLQRVSGGRMRRQIRRFDAHGIKLALQEAMLQEPAVPMRQVAKQLGYDVSYVYKYFPDLCRAISGRYRMHQEKNKLARLQRGRDELRQAMCKLHEQGIYPGQTRLQKVLSKPGLFRALPMRAAWHEVLQELGWKP